MTPIPSGQPDADLKFTASLQDDVSPRLDALEKKLKELGASPREIKMMMKAYDEATPKIKEARKLMDRMPEVHKFRFQADMADVNDNLDKIKTKTREPFHIQFVDNLSETMDRLTSIRTRIPLGGALPGGSNMLAATGAMAGAVGGVTALAGVVQQGVQVNSQMEQSMVTLNQTLKDQSKATSEMGKIVNIAQKTPFQYQDVLQADVRLRSYAIPSMPGEGGPGNQGWLKSAGDMAAAMNTPITQAVEAIADARQGYFVRMMSYGIRMMREDFQAGGKYAGMTYEQGLGQAIRRFQGAQELQSKTFQGLVSNIHDIFQQQVLRPIGAPAFSAVKQVAQTLQDKMQTPEFQLQLGREIEKVQRAFISMFELVQKGKDYFNSNLKQPLMDFGKQVISIGGTFVKTFGTVFVAVLKTVAQLFGDLVRPVSAFVSAHPKLVEIYATFKALSLLGFKGPADGLSKMADAINPLHPSVFKLVSGLKELTSGAIKVGIAAIVAGFVNAHSSAGRLENAMKKAGESGRDKFKEVNAEIAKMSWGLDMSSSKFRDLTTSALQHQEGGGTQTALAQAQMAAALHRNYGIDAGQANDLMNKATIRNTQDVERAGKEIRALASAANQLGMSFKDVTQVMSMFAGQTKGTPLGGLSGAPYLAAINKATNTKGFLTDSDTEQGIYSGDDLMRQLIDAYKSPSSDALGALSRGKKGMGRYYNFNNTYLRYLQGAGNEQSMDRENIINTGYQPTEGNQGLQVIRDVRNRYQANNRAQRQTQAGFQQILNETGVRPGGGLTAQDLKAPSLIDTSVAQTAPNIDKLISGSKTAADAVKVLNKAIQDQQQNITNTNDSIDQYTQSINKLNKVIANVSVRQQVLSMATEKLQHSYLPMQRQIEDMQLNMQKLSFNAMRPLERQSADLGQQMAVLGNNMQNAQYNMGKFSEGLFTGEQAALNQSHALERYNRELQILQMQYQSISGQLGTTTFDRGISTRVNPLMGLSLEMQMQRMQRKQQLHDLKYQDTYGEEHYQLEQAGRTANQRREMSFQQRLKGVKDNVKVIDDVNKAQHTLQNQQFDLQTKMYHVNKEMQKQQDAVTKLSIKLQDKQLHGGLRNLQDAQYHLGRLSEKANIQLTRQQTLLASAQDRLTDYKSIGEQLGKARDKLISMGGNPRDAAGRLVAFGEATGILDPKQAKQIQDQLAKATQGVRSAGTDDVSTKPGMIDAIKKGIWGAFTGETWRRLVDMGKGVKLPVVGDLVGGGPIGTIISTTLTALTAGYFTLALTGLISTLFKQTAIRGITSTLLRVLPEGGAASKAVGLGREIALGEGLMSEIVNAFRPIKRFKRFVTGGAVRAVTGPAGPILAPYAQEVVATNKVSDIRKGNIRWPGVEAWPGGEQFQNGLDKSIEKLQSGAAKIGIGGKDIKDGSARHVRAARIQAAAAEQEKNNVFGNKDATKDQKRAAASQHRAAQKNLRNVDKMRDDLIKNREESERALTRISGRFGGVVRRFGGRAGGVAMFALAIENFKSVITDFTGWFNTSVLHKPHPSRTTPPTKSPKERPTTTKGSPDHAHDPMHPAERKHWDAHDAARAAQSEAEKDPSFRKAVQQAYKEGHRYIRWGGKVLRVGGTAANVALGAMQFIPAADEVGKHHYKAAAADAAGASASIGLSAAAFAAGPEAVIPLTILDLLNANKNYSPAEIRKRRAAIQRAQGATGGQAAPIPAQMQRQITGTQEFAQWRWDPDNRQKLQGLNTDQLLKAYKDYLEKNLKNEKDSHKISSDEYTTYQEQLKALQKKYGDDRQTTQDNYHNSSLKSLQTYYTNYKTVTQTSNDDIYKVTDSFLKDVHHRINASAKAMGVSTGDTTTAPDTSPAHDTRPSTGAAAAAKHAHGGFPTEHVIRGKGDGRGHLIRVGEEDDELIIPLAPHRRERAKSLLKQAQGLIGVHKHHHLQTPTAAIDILNQFTQGKGSLERAGFIGPHIPHISIPAGAHRGYDDYANGGIAERFPGVDSAYTTARAAYAVAARGFAKGGFIGPFGTLPGMIPIANLAKKFGLTPTAGRTNHSYLSSSGLVSDHSWGGALDVSNGVLTPQEDAFAAFVKGKLTPMLGQLIWRDVIQAGRSTGFPVPGHKNHVHVALARQWAEDESAVAKFISRVEKGISVRQLIASVGTGGTTLGSSAMPDIHLPHVPKKLRHHGPVGLLAYRGLQKLKRQLSSYTSDGSGGPIPMPSNVSKSANAALAKRMAAARGWKGNEWSALANIWSRESGFDPTIHYGGGHGYKPGLAYGIPQALPGDKMSSAGSDWKSNPATQIKWGLDYVKSRYGDPLAAWAHWQQYKSYAGGTDHMVTKPRELFQAEQGERVQVHHPARAHAASNTQNDRKKHQMYDSIEDIKTKIKLAVEHLRTIKDKAEKAKDVDHLAELNRNLRQQYAKRAAAPAGKSDNKLNQTIINEGDTTGGMGTQALVSHEKGLYNAAKKSAVSVVVKSNVYKEAVKAASHWSGVAKKVVDYAHSAHSPGGKKVTHAESTAIRLSERAKRSSRAVPTAMKTTAALSAYLPGAVRRGVSSDLIKSITGHALSTHKNVLRDAHGHAIRQHGHVVKESVKQAYDKAVKDKPGSKQQSKDITNLRRSLTAELRSVKSKASHDQKAAAKAITKAFGSHASKLLNTSSKHHAESQKSRNSGHKATAAVAHHAKATAAAVNVHGNKNLNVAKQARDETAKVKKSSDKSDDKRSKAEIASDKRDRDFQDKALSHLEKISKLAMNVDVNVTNNISGTKVSTSYTAKRKRAK